MSLFGRRPYHGQNRFEICGCYWVEPVTYLRRYLPQAELSSYTKITPVCFSTHLTQRYSNTNDTVLKEIRYVFPLYDGVSVGGYKIQYGDKILEGVVKQKDQARKTYQAAVDRGETASLLESLPSGIFGVTLGNVPAKTDIYVTIEYLGELKHDAGIDGLRYNLPTSICPRYGDYPSEVTHTPTIIKDGIKIIVDIDMGKSAIRRIQSPSHPIAITMGNLSTEDTSAAYLPSKGSATLTSGSAELGQDFVLQLLIDDISRPQAVIEKHSSVDSRAIMATMVPKFNLPLTAPEIVFIADQSGSMGGQSTIALKAALNVFLKSLPFGAHFNICAFGSNFKYVFDKSQPYNEKSLKMATDFVDTFSAQYGGTEMLEPVKQAFIRRLGDLPLEIMLLTDGEIWGEQNLFQLIDDKLYTEKIDARVFTLGIGIGVSHTLVEGVARAGNGFAQFIVDNEEVDTKIVRMLKASLFPHTKDYTLEVNFDDRAEDVDDDFELVEKLDDQLHIEEKSEQSSSEPASTSFFDESVKLDEPIQSKDRYAHLPVVAVPNILQGPSRLPPLFPYNRTSLYFILGPDASRKRVQSVTLRATAPSGPLKLVIPVTEIEEGTMVHQLAARKIIQELEDGRGWLHEGKTTDGVSVKEKFKSRLPELAEREAVRLGELYDVANRWCSFVAVDATSLDSANADDDTPAEQRSAGAPGKKKTMSTRKRRVAASAVQSEPAFSRRSAAATDSDSSDTDGSDNGTQASRFLRDVDSDEDMGLQLFSDSTAVPPPPPAPAAYAMPMMRAAAPAGRGGLFGNTSAAPRSSSSLFGGNNGTFGSSQNTATGPNIGGLFGGAATKTPGGSLFGGAAPSSNSGGFGSTAGEGLFGVARNTPATTQLFGAATTAAAKPLPFSSASVASAYSFQNSGASHLVRPMHGNVKSKAASNAAQPESTEQRPVAMTPAEKLRVVINAQSFSGAWAWDEGLLALLGLDSTQIRGLVQCDQSSTALVLVWLEKHMADKRDVWELVADKGRAFLSADLDEPALQGLLAAFAKLL